MKYRSRTEIIGNILDSANGRATKTKIYVYSISKLRTIKGIPFLIENNLIEYLNGTQTYKTTEKGLNYLKKHNEIGELLQTTTIIKNNKLI